MMAAKYSVVRMTRCGDVSHSAFAFIRSSLKYVYAPLWFSRRTSNLDALSLLASSNGRRTAPARIFQRIVNIAHTMDISVGSRQIFGTTPGANPANVSVKGTTDTLDTKDAMGVALFRQGKSDAAITLLRELLTSRERLGQTKADPNMLKTMNNLGAALKGNGRLAEAEALHRQVLEADEQNLEGDNTDDVSTSLNNLADVLMRQGRLDAAAELQQRAFEMKVKAHGPEHPDTLGAMGNLAQILGRQQKYEQAERMTRECLALRQKVLKADDSDIASSMNNLAAILGQRGDLHGAEELYRQALTMDPTDIERADYNSNLAGVLVRQGRYDEAESSLCEATKIFINVSGKENLSTKSTMKKLADVLTKNGKFKEAEEALAGISVIG